jgi:RNA polymerase sigma factor (sigma-70 family)
MHATKEEVAEALENAYRNISNFHKRLLFFALSKIRYYFHTNSFQNYTAADVVQETLVKIIGLKKKWYPAHIPDFHKFVRFAILSFIRNERKKKEKIKTVDLYDENGSFAEENIKDLLKEYAREDFVEKLFRDDLETVFEKCLNELEHDVYAHFVLEERLESVRSNIAIADKLGIEVSEVEKARKRIRTKFQRLLGS